MTTTTTTKPANRGHLLRAARKGKLFVKCRYHYTDDYAWDAASDFGKQDEYVQVYLCPDLPDEASREERAVLHQRHVEAARGMESMREWEFRSRSGWMSGDTQRGTFGVHSNLSYDYEIRK